MGISFLKIAGAALLLAIAMACNSDSEGDGDSNNPLADGGADPDSAACDCTLTRLQPDALEVGRLDLDCYCREYGCKTYAESTTPSNACSLPYAKPELFHYPGCNLLEVQSGFLSGSRFTYDATTHELLGAYRFTDTPAFECAGESVGGLVAGVKAYSDFPDCELGERTPICP